MNKEDFTKLIIDYIHNPKNDITDTTEEVSASLYYSKTMRIICVLDEEFDDNTDGLLSLFYADSVGQTECSECYPSDYGDITISQKEDSSVTVKFAEEEDD